MWVIYIITVHNMLVIWHEFYLLSEMNTKFTHTRLNFNFNW